MIKEKRRKSGLTALELDRLNPRNKFIKKIIVEEDIPLFFIPSRVSNRTTIIFKFSYSGPGNPPSSNIIYYKKGSGIALEEITKNEKRLIDLETLHNLPEDSFIRSLSCREPCVFRFANIAEIFGSTINMLRNGESNN